MLEDKYLPITSAETTNEMKSLVFGSTRIQVWQESFIFNSRSLTQNTANTQKLNTFRLFPNPKEKPAIKPSSAGSSDRNDPLVIMLN